MFNNMIISVCKCYVNNMTVIFKNPTKDNVSQKCQSDIQE